MVYSRSALKTAIRFASYLADTWSIDIDAQGLFDQSMFVSGKQNLTEKEYTLWRVAPDGSITKFAQAELDPAGITCFAFGADGALYVPEYSPEYRIVIISRISPAQTLRTDSLDK